MQKEREKIINSLNETIASLDKSIPFYDEKIRDFRFISEQADARGKSEMGHAYNDMANLLGVLTEHARILGALAEFEKNDYQAILDLFELAKEIDESVLKKEEFKEKLEKLEKREKQGLRSKFPLKLDTLKLNFGVGSATFKPKEK